MFSDLYVTDVVVAEFRESIRLAIPMIALLLRHGELDVRRAGTDALSKLSEQGSISSFLTFKLTLLMYYYS